MLDARRQARLPASRARSTAARPPTPTSIPFWARVNETGIPVTFHAIGGLSPYDDMFTDSWCQPGTGDHGYQTNLRQALFPHERAAMDTLTALILGCTFQRFPNVKVAIVEMGCTWVEYFMHALDHAGGLLDRRVEAFGHTGRRAPLGGVPAPCVDLPVPRGGRAQAGPA